MSGVFDQQPLSMNGFSMACTTSEKATPGRIALRPASIGAPGDSLTGTNFLIDRIECNGHLHLSFLSAVKCMYFCLHKIAALENARPLCA